MNKRIFAIFISLGIVSIILFGMIKYRSNTDRLFDNFLSQLKAEKFEEIYDVSADDVKRSVSKPEFVRRMRDVLDKLKGVDENLAFEKDTVIETVIGKEEGLTALTYTTFQRLSKGERAVTLTVYWSNEGVVPKFHELYVVPKNEQSKPYQVYSVSHLKSTN